MAKHLPSSSDTRTVRAARPRGARMAAELKVLDWPDSPYYEPIEDTEAPREEPAIALLRDGRRLIGALTRFDPVDGVFEMLPQGGDLIEIAPQDLLELRLTRSVKLRRRRSVLDDPADESNGPPEPQIFRITLANSG